MFDVSSESANDIDGASAFDIGVTMDSNIVCGVIVSIIFICVGIVMMVC